MPDLQIPDRGSCASSAEPDPRLRVYWYRSNKGGSPLHPGPQRSQLVEAGQLAVFRQIDTTAMLSPSTIHAGAKDLINSWSICVRVFRARVWIWVSPEIPIEIGADRQTSATCLGEILRGRTETIGRRP